MNDRPNLAPRVALACCALVQLLVVGCGEEAVPAVKGADTSEADGAAVSDGVVADTAADVASDAGEGGHLDVSGTDASSETDGFSSGKDGFSSGKDGFGSGKDGFGSGADGFGDGADGSSSAADADSTEGDSVAVPVATTCTAQQWAACDDGDPCTQDECAPHGCHHFDADGCDSCPLYARKIGGENAISTVLWDAAAIGAGVVALGQVGDNSDSKPFLVARSADGQLQWTLKYSSSQPLTLRAIAARDDGFVWLVGQRQISGASDGTIVRLKSDGKAAIEWFVHDASDDIDLRDGVTTHNNGIVAIGRQTSASGAPTGLVVWRDNEGTLTGPQSAKTAQNRLLSAIEPDPMALGSYWIAGTNVGNKSGVVVHVDSDGVLKEYAVAKAGADIALAQLTALDGGGVVAVGTIKATTAQSLLVMGDSAGFKQFTPQVTSPAGVAAPLFTAVTSTQDDQVWVVGSSGSLTGSGPGATIVAKISTKTGGVLWQKSIASVPSSIAAVARIGGHFRLVGAIASGQQKGQATPAGWMLRTNAQATISCLP